MAKNPDLKQLLELFKTKRILIVGDVMVDEYLWGNVSRISPEAPVPVVSCVRREHRMGGAANVAINVKSLGAEPVMCSVIGNDTIGAIYRQILAEKEMTDAGIVESSERMTTVKTRVIGNHQHLLRVDHEITTFLAPDIEKQLIAKIENIIGADAIDAIIFQDYDKGVLTPQVITTTTRLAREKNIPTLVDPKKRGFLSYYDVDLFKPNFHELNEGLNRSLSKNDLEGIFDAAQEIHTTYNVRNVMVTLSEKGVFISDGRQYKVIPAEVRDITDVSGAGDTVICVAALGMASGLSPFQCAALANLAGGLVCEKVGVVPIEPELLLKEDLVLPGE